MKTQIPSNLIRLQIKYVKVEKCSLTRQSFHTTCLARLAPGFFSPRGRGMPAL